ncbi:MAG: hypothetical protein AAF333_07605 [Planctomycetota bacterium]
MRAELTDGITRVPYGVAAFLALCGLLAASCANADTKSREAPMTTLSERQVRGWTLLSNRDVDAETVIKAARRFEINHLQLSHHIVHDLRHVREPSRREQVNRLTRLAHEQGIEEVVVWDHALYHLDYYPARFRTGPDGTLDLDNPEFWKWLKADYREMLNMVPDIDGIVLTFIETGARVERQHSIGLETPAKKLAAVVNAVGDVVIGERGLSLYARTFAYTHEEYENITQAIAEFRYPQIVLMMKETPHDFFLTHPNNWHVGEFAQPTLIEFDTTGEFNGQGVIANTWPQHFLRRWADFAKRDHVVGYVARTDRYGGTRIVDRPTEINLLALKMGLEDPRIDPDTVYDTFITQRYGTDAIPHLKPAFRNAYAIVTSSLYVLGTNASNHSHLNYDPYPSSYERHVSGKWLDPPTVFVDHGVNREFHYWKDIVQPLAPPWAKQITPRLIGEIPDVVEEGWLTPTEEITEEFLGLVLTEKDYGVRLADESLAHIEAARPHLSPADYEELRHHFARTLITARLYRAAAASYFGFRVYARGESFQTPTLMATVRQALLDLRDLAEEIEQYPVAPEVGQWDWTKDAGRARRYFHWIVVEGWPARTNGFANPYGGLTFPLE